MLPISQQIFKIQFYKEWAKYRGSICDEVQQAGYLSLMADETKDFSKQEQLATVLRYLYKEGTINERFLTFIQVISLYAESLSNYLIKV